MSGSSTITVGITGHRPNRMHVGAGEIARQLRLILSCIRSGVGDRVQRFALSALAEGADRLFADAALALGYQLEAILPFAISDYETTFEDSSTTPHFHQLLGQAAKVTELPGKLGKSTTAYEAVGRATVSESDIVLAVWDGQPAAGRGGTPEIIEQAMRLDKPVVWINAALVRLPHLIIHSTASGSRRASLAQIARRAKPLTRRRLEALAARAVSHSR